MDAPTSATDKKIGILGGTFDPVHLGHLGLARNIRSQLDLDAVWFLPAWRSPHKQEQAPAGANHRVQMLELALQPYPEFQISTIELERKDVSYTIDTLEALHRQYPDREWTLILGMDAFRDFATWKNPGGILRKANLAVATRPGFSEADSNKTMEALTKNTGLAYRPVPGPENAPAWYCPETNHRIVFCNIPPQDISSRQVREALRRSQSIKNMLPPGVEGYIIKNLLYRANPQPQPE